MCIRDRTIPGPVSAPKFPAPNKASLTTTTATATTSSAQGKRPPYNTRSYAKKVINKGGQLGNKNTQTGTSAASSTAVSAAQTQANRDRLDGISKATISTIQEIVEQELAEMGMPSDQKENQGAMVEDTSDESGEEQELSDQ